MSVTRTLAIGATLAALLGAACGGTSSASQAPTAAAGTASVAAASGGTAAPSPAGGTAAPSPAATAATSANTGATAASATPATVSSAATTVSGTAATVATVAGTATTASGKVSANKATRAELQAAFAAAGISNPASWAREVEEYRPYPSNDPNFPKLRQELAKYNPGPGVVDKIIATLEP